MNQKQAQATASEAGSDVPYYEPQSHQTFTFIKSLNYVTSKSCQGNMNTTIKIADNNNGNNMMTMKKWLNTT